MTSNNVKRVALLLWIALACSALPAAPNEINLLTTPAPLMNPPLPALGNGRSSLNDSQRDCRGAQYGTNLNYDSCLDAFRTFELGTYPSPIQVRKRNTGEGVFAIWLPYRLISGTWEQGALCTAVDPQQLNQCSGVRERSVYHRYRQKRNCRF